MARLDFIDTAKGVAIIVMVMFHSIMGLEVTIPGDNVNRLVTFEQYTFLSWFMPIFFVIVGYCSDFNKSFKPFITGLVMSIGFPIFFFDIIPYNVSNFVNESFQQAILQLPLSLIRFFRYSFWFLRALFMGKLLYWFINKYTKCHMKYIAVVFSYLIACFSVVSGHIHGANSLIILLFILVGQEIKKKELLKNKYFGIANITTYILTMTIMYLCKYKPPFFLDQLHFGIYDIFYLAIVSLTGSLSVLYLCNFLSWCKLLTYIGKHTLVIYCLHHAIFKLGFWPIASANMNLLSIICCLFSKVIVTIAICVCISSILYKPFMRIIIGKRK